MEGRHQWYIYLPLYPYVASANRLHGNPAAMRPPFLWMMGAVVMCLHLRGKILFSKTGDDIDLDPVIHETSCL